MVPSKDGPVSKLKLELSAPVVVKDEVVVEFVVEFEELEPDVEADVVKDDPSRVVSMVDPKVEVEDSLLEVFMIRLLNF